MSSEVGLGHVALELAMSWAFVFGGSCLEFLENIAAMPPGDHQLLLSLKLLYGIDPRPVTEITELAVLWDTMHGANHGIGGHLKLLFHVEERQKYPGVMQRLPGDPGTIENHTLSGLGHGFSRRTNGLICTDC